MAVASLDFDLIHARRVNDRIMIRGVQTATPAYSWVTDPAFLAAHPEIVAALNQPQAAIGEIRIADDGSLKMNFWSVPN